MIYSCTNSNDIITTAERSYCFAEDLYRLMSKEVLAVAKSLLNYSSRESIICPDDILQETFCKIMATNTDRFPTDKKHLKHYVLKIARNVFNDLSKKESYTNNSNDESMLDRLPFPEIFSEGWEKIDYADANRYLLGQLTSIQKTVFTMSQEGYTFKETATILNMTESNIKYHFGKARDKLRSSAKNI